MYKKYENLSINSAFMVIVQNKIYKELEMDEERNPTRCNNFMFIINFCHNMFRASLCPFSGEQRPCYCIWCVVMVLLDVVELFEQKPSQCSHPTRQRPTTATNHIQQNQNTPNAVTEPFFS